MPHKMNSPTFEQIIDYAWDMWANEEVEVYEFGKNKDLILHIYKDEDYNPDIDEECMNLVDIYTAMNGKYVDDACGIHVRDLWNELERINNYKDFTWC